MATGLTELGRAMIIERSSARDDLDYFTLCLRHWDVQYKDLIFTYGNGKTSTALFFNVKQFKFRVDFDNHHKFICGGIVP